MQNTFSRFEFKYPIQDHLISRIEDDLLLLGFKRDVKFSSGQYTVSSVYFETPHLSDFFDKIGGILGRRKVRARIYGKEVNNTDRSRPSVSLEIKEKYDMMICKRRIWITPEEWETLLESPHAAYRKISSRRVGKERHVADDFIFLLASQQRKPFLLVQYERKAFELGASDNPIRITLDFDIFAKKTHLFSPHPNVAVSRKKAVMELKFKDRLPWQVKFLLTKYNLKRDAYSKYAASVDAVKKFYPISR
ncbi:MAG: polyphosphate polymerase domain-containing protein [Candidatus Spechtbacteria bacterium]|nr:polyphosphate polymerase domain-containing protein [Candidatus Spechtbacteria bacterium]